MKRIICVVAGLMLFSAVLALPLDQEDPQLQEEVKSFVPPDQDIQPESIKALEISTDGSGEDAVRAKKSYPGSGGATVCMQVQNGPYESPVTICRDEPSYGSGYHNQGASYGGEHNGVGNFGAKPFGAGPYGAGSYGSGYGGKPALGVGAGFGHAGGKLFGAGPYGAVQSHPVGYGGGQGLGLGAGNRPEYGYGSSNIGLNTQPGIVSSGPQSLHSGAYGNAHVTPHHVPHYRSGELELADSITRGIMTSLGSRSAYGPSYGTGSYSGQSSQYLGNPHIGTGPAQGLYPHAQVGYGVPLQSNCQSNLPQGSLTSNSYGESVQFSHHGPPAYKNVDDITESRDQSAKKLFEGTKPSELLAHGATDASAKGPEDLAKNQKEMKARMNSLTSETGWDSKA